MVNRTNESMALKLKNKDKQATKDIYLNNGFNNNNNAK